MKKVYAILVLFSLVFVSSAFCAAQKEKSIEASGEVTSVDPMYSRVSIKHAAIKGFAGDGETEFVVASSDMLKNVSRRDLVNFVIVDKSGEVTIENIKRTGQASIVEEKTPLGTAVRDVLSATGDVARTVTTPITPVHDVVSGTMGATEDTTNSVLNESEKRKF